MDDLSRIERSYGSVAEYNRSRQEDEEHEWEMQHEINLSCEENKMKLEENEEISVWFSDDCFECEHYEDVGPRFYYDDGFYCNVDDVPHGLCHNCNRMECEIWKERNGL